MDSKQDIRLLFKDLFTHTEYKMFAKRLEIARRLLRGETYDFIQSSLNVTSGTITRVNELLLNRGDGLRKANFKLENLEKEYFAKQKEITKNLENPWRQKAKRKTLLGTLLKAGIKEFDKALVKKLKQQTAKKDLPV